MKFLHSLINQFHWWRACRFITKQCQGLVDLPHDVAMQELARWRWDTCHKAGEKVPERYREMLMEIFDAVEEMLNELEESREK